MEAVALSEAIDLLLANCKNEAQHLIAEKYPFKPDKVQNRSYSEKEKMQIFLKDGFVDRYSGKQLVNPGILKSITYFFPEEFPYHPHWKMNQCHKAYWDLLPTSKRSLYTPTSAAEKSFYCPLYNGKITQYDCDELCCGVKTGYFPNDGLPHLMKLSDISRKRESCIKCSRNKA